MKRYKLVIQYDGTNYHGWQQQPNPDLPTIQGEVEKALALIYKDPVKILAAGRTDSGVHAEGQVIAFDNEKAVPAERIANALNSILPEDIVVISCEEASLDFHPRYDAIRKWYRYTIYYDQLPNVFLRNYSWHISYQLDLAAMAGVGKYLIGTHDFSSFCSTKTGVKTFVRTLEKCTLTIDEKLLCIDLVANGFLYNMVRIIVGTMVEVGRGRFKLDNLPEIIAERDRRKAGPTAPPRGLCLKKIYY